MKILVARHRELKMTMRTVHPSKTTGEFVIKRLMAFLRGCGCEMFDLTVKSDQEAIM